MKNMILTITGPSLSGKSTMETMLVDKFKMGKITSFTTRPMRQGEVSGEHYYFLKRDVINAKILSGEVAEHIDFQGHLYGILGSELQNKLKTGPCIAVVEPNGARQLSMYCQENDIQHKAIFLTNDPAALVARFLERFKKDEKASPINYCTRLINLVRKEQDWIHQFDYDAIYTRFDSGNQDRVIYDISQKFLEQG